MPKLIYGRQQLVHLNSCICIFSSWTS